MINEIGFPAGSRTFLFQVCGARTKDDGEFIPRQKVAGDIDPMGQKHVISGEDQFTIQPNFGQGGETIEAEETQFFWCGIIDGKRSPIPPILTINVHGGLMIPFPLSLQCGANRAGNKSGKPVCLSVGNEPRWLGAAGPLRVD